MWRGLPLPWLLMLDLALMIPQTQGTDVHLASSRMVCGMRQRKKMGKAGESMTEPN